jgi:hypothetical protein
LSEGDHRIRYAPRPGATPEVELNSLAAVYRLVLDCHVQKVNRPTTSGRDDAVARHKQGVSRVEQGPDTR